MENSDINGNALSLCNTDLNLAHYMGKKKTNHQKNHAMIRINSCPNYQKTDKKPSE